MCARPELLEPLLLRAVEDLALQPIHHLWLRSLEARLVARRLTRHEREDDERVGVANRVARFAGLEGEQLLLEIWREDGELAARRVGTRRRGTSAEVPWVCLN